MRGDNLLRGGVGLLHGMRAGIPERGRESQQAGSLWLQKRGCVCHFIGVQGSGGGAGMMEMETGDSSSTRQ